MLYNYIFNLLTFKYRTYGNIKNTNIPTIYVMLSKKLKFVLLTVEHQIPNIELYILTYIERTKNINFFYAANI